MSELTTILEDLLGEPQFLYALAAGAVIVVVFYGLRRAYGSLPVGWALAYGTGALAVLGLLFPVDSSLLVSLVLVVAAGALVDVAGFVPARRWRAVVQAVAWGVAAVFSLLFASAITPELDPWLQITLASWVLAVAVAVRSLDRSSLADVVAPMLAITVIGIWVTVPETDMIEALLGLSLPMALVTVSPINGRATASGLFLVACLLGWLIVDGAAGRDVATLGGLVSAGMLVLAPLIRIRRPGIRKGPVLAAHLVFTVVATRFVDWIASPSGALIALGVLTVVTLVALLLLPGLEGDLHAGVEEETLSAS